MVSRSALGLGEVIQDGGHRWRRGKTKRELVFPAPWSNEIERILTTNAHETRISEDQRGLAVAPKVGEICTQDYSTPKNCEQYFRPLRMRAYFTNWCERSQNSNGSVQGGAG